jgi:hypothetical protein
MKTTTISYRVPYALALVTDRNGGDAPVSLGPDLIAATDSCIAIGCRPDCDAETRFTVGDVRDLGLGTTPDFECSIQTPSSRMIVQTVESVVFLEVDVVEDVTNVRIWTNDPLEPDHIVIGIG